jgi:hypothetical protein
MLKCGSGFTKAILQQGAELEEKGFLPTVKQVCHKDSLEFSTM